MTITPGGNPVCKRCGLWYGIGEAHSCRHNHPTRDIRPRGQCPACDRHHDMNSPDDAPHALGAWRLLALKGLYLSIEDDDRDRITVGCQWCSRVFSRDRTIGLGEEDGDVEHEKVYRHLAEAHPEELEEMTR